MGSDFDQEYWQRRWQNGHGDAPGTMDGNPPNPYLIRAAVELAPGTALDAGCGAGAEAIWLADRGWRVTAVDISAEALTSAARRAAESGVSRAVFWIEADLTRWNPGMKFELVTTHYAHAAMPQLAFYARLADWVAVGGTLLIVGHLQGHETHAQETHGQETHGQDAHGQDAHGQETHGQDARGHETHGQETHGQETHAQEPHTQEPHRHEPDGHEPHTQDPHAQESHGLETHRHGSHSQDPHRQDHPGHRPTADTSASASASTASASDITAAALPADTWEIITAAEQTRTLGAATLHDVVVQAKRLR